MYIYGFVIGLAKGRHVALERLKVTLTQLTIFKLHCIVLFNWLSLNNFRISFLIFYALEPLNIAKLDIAIVNIANPSSLYKPFIINLLILPTVSQTCVPLNPPMVTSNNPSSFWIQICWSLKSRHFLAWNIITLSFSNISVCCQ